MAPRNTTSTSAGAGARKPSLASIRRTMERGSLAERESLLRGLRAFGEGAVQYHEQNLDSAREIFARVARDLSVAENPLRFWARFYVALGEYNSRADRGLASFEALLNEIPRERWPALAGRIEWSHAVMYVVAQLVGAVAAGPQTVTELNTGTLITPSTGTFTGNFELYNVIQVIYLRYVMLPILCHPMKQMKDIMAPVLRWNLASVT